MDSQTIRTALGRLQDDPDSQEAWQQLREAVLEPEGDLDQDGLIRLLEAARSEHQQRGEWEAVAGLLDVHSKFAGADEINVMLELARVHQEELLDDEAAEVCFLRVIELEPDHQAATHAIGEGEAKRGNWKDLVKTYLGEAEEAPDEVYKSSMLMRAAEMEFRYGGEDQSKDSISELLERAVRLDPSNGRAGRMLERLYRTQDKWDATASVLERLADRSTETEAKIAAGVRLARLCLLKLDDPNRAARAYEQVVRAENTHSEARGFLSEYYSKEERWDDLVALYERELESADLNNAETIGEMLQIAMLHWKKREKPEDADNWFERIRKLDAAHPLCINFYREYCAATGDEGRLVNVLQGAQRVMKEGAEKAEIGAELAKLAESQQNAQKAIEQYKGVLRQDPDNSEARDALKRLYRQTEGHNALVELLRQQLERTPQEDTETRLAILREAASVYRQSLKSDTALVSVLNQIVQADPTDIAAVRELITLYERLGRWRDLLTTQQKLAELTESTEEKADLYRAAARRWLDQFSNVQNATNAYASLLEVAPGDREAIERLNELYKKRRAWPQLYALFEGELEAAEGSARVSIMKEMAQLAAERLQKPDDAIRLFQSILEADPDSAETLDSLERYAERSKNWPVLADALERRVEGTEDDAQKVAVLQKLGSVYGDQLKDSEGATRAWRRVLDLQPGHHRALRVLRDTYLSAGDFDGLEDLYASQDDYSGLADVLSSAADKSKDPTVKVALSYRAAAVYEEKLDQPDRAFRSYERILATDPSDARAAGQLIPLYESDEKWARLPALYDVIYASTDDDAEKLELLNKLVTITSSRLNDKKAAASYARKAYDLAPASETALTLFEQTAADAGSWDSFVEALSEQLASDSLDGEQRRSLTLKLATVCADQLGQTDEAISRLKGLLETSPADAEAAGQLEAILRREGKRDDLRWLLGLRTEHADSDDERVRILAEWATLEEEVFEEPAKAVELHRRVLEAAPDDAASLVTLPRLLIAQNDYASAAEVIERHRDQLDGAERAEREVQLAELYLDHLERPSDAMDAAVRALELSESDARAMTVLERLVENETTRDRAAELLATQYATSGEARREAQAIEVMLDATTERGPRLDLYQRLADVQEEKLGAYGNAFEVMLKAAREFPDELALWNRADGLAALSGRPTDLADAFREVTRGDLAPDILSQLCERAAALHEDKLGDPIGATPYLEKVLELEPSNERAFRRLKDILTAAERWGELESLYDRASQATEDEVRRTEMLVEVALICEEIIEDNEKATQYYERILKVDPIHDTAIRALDRLYAAQGRDEDLAQLLEKRLELAVGDELLDMKLRLARIQLEKLHRPGNAVVYVDDVLAERPNDYDARELAEKMLEIGNLRARAARMLESVYDGRDEVRDLVRVLEVRLSTLDDEKGDGEEPDDPEEVLALRKDLLRRIATLRDERIKDDEGALNALAQLVPLEPLDLDARARLVDIGRRIEAHGRVAEVLEQAATRADVLAAQAEILMQVAQIKEDLLDDMDGAVATYVKVRELDSDDAEIVLPAARALERIYAGAGDHKKLAETLRTQVRLEQDGDARRGLYGRLGELCQSVLDDDAGAIEAWRARLDDDGTDAEALAALDALYEKTGEWRSLVEVLERRQDATQDGGERRTLMVRAAKTQAEKLEATPEAIDTWRAVLDEFGADLEPLQALEPLYEKAERWDELSEAYETHLDLVSEPDERLDLLAKLGDLRRAHLSNVEGALEAYRQALSVDPSHAPSRSALLHLTKSEDAIARREAAEILHPLFEQDDDHEALLSVIEIEVEASDDPVAKLGGLEKAMAVADERLDDQARAFGFAERAVRAAVGHTDLSPRLEQLERLAGATQKQAEYVKLLCEVVPEIFDGDVQLEVTLKIAELARHQLADRELAQEYYKKALDIRGDDRSALVALESLYEESGDAQNLLEILERRVEAAEGDDERKELLFRRANLLADVIEDTDSAIQVHESILDVDLDQRALTALEKLYTQSERWLDLTELYQRQLDAGSGSPAELRVKTAIVAAQKQGDVARAFDELEAALEVEQQNEPAVAELERLLTEAPEPEQRARAAAMLEPVYLVRADFDRVMKTIEARLEHGQDPTERRDLLSRLAQLHEEQKEDYGAALETTAKLLSEDPSDQETVSELERLAKVAGAERRLAEIYAGELGESAADEGTAKLAERTGELFAELGEHDRSLTFYRRALEFEPESLALFERIDELLVKTEKHEERVDLYRSALDHRFEPAERSATLHTIAALQREQLSQPEEAIETYRLVLDVDETDVRALDALTELYRDQKRWDDLAELYVRRAESAASPSEGAEYRLALSNLAKEELNDTSRAIDQLEEIVQEVPGHAAAVAALQELLEDDDHKQRVVEILRPLYEEADDWRHLITLNEERFALAMDDAEKVGVLRETARLWEERGNDLDRSRRAYGAAVALDADDADVRHDYERLVETTSAWDELTATYESVLEKRPDLASKRDVLAKLADVHDAKRDDPRRALEAYGRLREVAEGEIEPLEKMEQLATLLSDWPVLVSVLEAKADLILDDEERASVWRRVGEAKRDMLEDSDGAVDAYEKALDLDPESAFTVDCLIDLHEAREQPERLVELYQRRVELSDDEFDGELRYNLLTAAATVYESKLSDRMGAIEALRQAQAAQPEQTEVLASLNRLYREEEMWPELLDNLRLEASTTEDTETRSRLRTSIGEILAGKLQSYEEALDAYQLVLEETPGAADVRGHVRQLGQDHEDLRERVAQILVPVLRSVEAHTELVSILEMRLTIETDPATRSETQRAIGEVFETKLDQPSEALGSLLRALAESPEAADIHTDVERLAAASDGWGRYADALYERAQATFDAELAKDLYSRLGRLAEERLDNPKRAIEAYNHAVEQAGDQPELLEALDRLHEKVEDWPALSEILERRVLLDASDDEQAQLYYRLGQLQVNEFKEPARGLGSLRSALERVPTHDGAAAMMEVLTDDRDLFEEAAEVLEGVYRSRGMTGRLATLYEKRVGFADAPGDRIEMRRNLAKVLEDDCQDAAAAQRVLQQGLKDDPTDQMILDEIERLAPMTDDWRGAASALMEAVDAKADLLPDTAKELSVRVALWYRDKVGDGDAAEKALKRALEFDSHSDETLVLLEQLQQEGGRTSDLIDTLRRRAKLQHDEETREKLYQRATELARGEDNAELTESILRELLEHNDANRWALGELTEVRAAAGDHKETFQLLVKRTEQSADAQEITQLRHRAARLAETELDDAPAAIELYDALFEDDPSDVDASTRLRALFTESKRFEELGRMLERLVDMAESPDERGTLRIELAELHSKHFETPDTAIDLLGAVLEEEPSRTEAVVALSELYEQTGRDEDLAQLLDRQIEGAQSRGDTEAELTFQVRLGEVYDSRLKNRARAIETYRLVLERDENHRGALEALARLHRAEGQHAEAAQTLDRLLAMSEGEAAQKLSMELADEYEAVDDKVAAAGAIERGLAADDKHRELRDRLAGLYRATENWAELAQLTAGDAELADSEDDRVQLLRDAAAIHADKRDDQAAAAELLERASALRPDDREILLQLCDAYSASGHGGKAVEVLERIVESYGGKRSKELGDIHRRLATAYLADGNTERALSELDKAFRIEPGNVNVLKQLGAVSLETGDLKKAQQMFRALLLQKLGPDAPITKAEVFMNLGDVHGRMGEKPKAIQMLERALQTDDSLDRAKELLAELKG